MSLACPSCNHKITNYNASNCSACGCTVNSYFRDYFSQLKPYKHFHNDVLVEEGFYKDSKKEFIWKNYHANGLLAELGVFKSGVKQEVWESFYDTGELQTRGSYIDGNKHGEWKHYSTNGDLLITELYEDGKGRDAIVHKY